MGPIKQNIEFLMHSNASLSILRSLRSDAILFACVIIALEIFDVNFSRTSVG